MSRTLRAPNAPTVILKGTTQTVTSSSTVEDDDEFFFDGDSQGIYVARLHIFWQSSIAGDIKFGWSGTATTAISWGYVDAIQPANNISDTDNILSDDGLDKTTGISAYISIGATAGRVNFKWSQDTPDGDPTQIYAGSRMIIRRST